MSELAAEYAALSRARDRLSGISEDLEQERTALADATQNLLAGDWTGPAAQAWGSAFQEWAGGAQTVLDGLHGMGTLIDQARVRLQQQDDDVSSAMNRLHARLGSGS